MYSHKFVIITIIISIISISISIISSIIIISIIIIIIIISILVWGWNSYPTVHRTENKLHMANSMKLGQYPCSIVIFIKYISA